MDIVCEMNKKRARLETQVQTYNAAIEQMPEGKLEVARNGSYEKFFSIRNGKREYLKKSETERIEGLAKKRYLQELVKDAQTEIKAIDLYLKYHKDNSCAEKLLAGSNGISMLLKELVVPLDVQLYTWAEEDYPKYQGFPEKLVHEGPFGKKYRSKTEANIAFLLTKYCIPYRYEWEQLINGVGYPIDFTTRHPKTGQFIYWEHFGRMHQPSYTAKIGAKLLDFESVGIFPDKNLIMTFESQRFPMNISQLEEIVQRWFL